MERSLEKLTEQLQRRLFVELEASGRHVHVTREQADVLFGHDLTPSRPLSQPGQYLAQERVTLRTPKGEIKHVAVLGPCRKEAQVELSMTDAVSLGLKPPVRLSGDVKGSSPIAIIGEKGTVELPQGAMVAQRHIHMTPEDAALQGVQNGAVVLLIGPEPYRCSVQQGFADNLIWHVQQLPRRENAQYNRFIRFFFYIIIIMVIWFLANQVGSGFLLIHTFHDCLGQFLQIHGRIIPRSPFLKPQALASS